MRRFLDRLLRRRKATPPPATPQPPPGSFYDNFADGIRQWELETGSGHTGQQVYTAESSHLATKLNGLFLIARPDRTSARVISREAPFIPGTRLTYVAELDPENEAVWPALWAIGKSTDWPECGEVDVMECNLGGLWKIKQTVHTKDTHRLFGDYGEGPGSRDVPDGPSVYTAEWRDGHIHFAVNGIDAGTVAYAASEPLRLVMNVALRQGVRLDREWTMRVREVSVDKL